MSLKGVGIHLAENLIEMKKDLFLININPTDYLLSSPNNAAHLRKALEDFQQGQRNFAWRYHY